MIVKSFRTSKNFALEIVMFHFLRSLKDGLTIFNAKFEADWYKGDHNPKLVLHVVILNTTIIEVTLYNREHEK